MTLVLSRREVGGFDGSGNAAFWEFADGQLKGVGSDVLAAFQHDAVRREQDAERIADLLAIGSRVGNARTSTPYITNGPEQYLG